MITIKEIHNRENLQPQDYVVLDYLDNQPPRFGPWMTVEEFAAMRKQWAKDFERYLGDGFRALIHNCHHCGNGMVRYLAVCLHKPTGEKLIFGSECVHKLGFEDRKQLVLAQIKAKAEQGHARLKAWTARCEFLEANPELKKLIDDKVIDLPVHKDNHFAQDLLRKFNQYGSLSPSQLGWLFKTLDQDVERAERKQRDAEEKARMAAEGVKAPEGRCTVQGEVLHTRWQENAFGGSMKWLVKLDNGTKVWSTIPATLTAAYGNGELEHKRVEFTATFERKPEDATFAFGSRPTKGVIL